MELESADGSKIPIDIDSDTIIGRGLGLPIPTTDRTIARRHLSLRLLAADAESNAVSRVSFQVIGKNPVLIHTASGEKRVYRESEKGDLLPGDRISLSLKHPSFFTLVKREGGEAAVDKTVLDAVARREREGGEAAVDKTVLDAVARRERRTRERRKEKEQMEDLGDQAEDDDGDDVLDTELGSLDVSQIDPIKEFGFLVNGSEFDVYPKKMIRPAMKWNWFLEEERRVDNDDDNDDEDMGGTTSSKGMKRGKGRGRRKKRGGDDEDDVWTGESEDDKELAVRAGGIKRSKYSTRSKDPKKPRREALSGRGSSSRTDAKAHDDELEEEDEDEEDETLGGFIIDDDKELVDEEEEESEDEEDEEELVDEEESEDEEDEEELEDEDED